MVRRLEVGFKDGFFDATCGYCWHKPAENAGILATEILGSRYPEVREAVRKHKKELEDMVHSKSKDLIGLGPSVYVEKMEKK
jgi:hypothetical protein